MRRGKHLDGAVRYSLARVRGYLYPRTGHMGLLITVSAKGMPSLYYAARNSLELDNGDTNTVNMFAGVKA